MFIGVILAVVRQSIEFVFVPLAVAGYRAGKFHVYANAPAMKRMNTSHHYTHNIAIENPLSVSTAEQIQRTDHK